MRKSGVEWLVQAVMRKSGVEWLVQAVMLGAAEAFGVKVAPRHSTEPCCFPL